MSPISTKYSFEGFHLDTNEEKLLYENEAIPLEPRVFQTLLLMVKNAGRTIKKDEFLETVWQDAIVEEGNLPVAIAKLRKALKEKNSSMSFIETVPRKGYQFNKKVRLQISEINVPDLVSIERVPDSSEPETFRSAGKKSAVKWFSAILILLSIIALGLFRMTTSDETPFLRKIEISSRPDEKRQLFINLTGENFEPETVRIRVIGAECFEYDPCEVPNGALKKWSHISENSLENVPLTLPPGRFRIFIQNGNSKFSNALVLDVP